MGAVKTLNQDQVIQLLRKRQGDRTAKELAEELGISEQYLSDVFQKRRDIGPALCEGLGLEREVTFRPLAAKEGLSA